VSRASNAVPQIYSIREVRRSLALTDADERYVDAV